MMSILLPQAVTAPDAVFELASMVMAVAVWRMRRAAFLCRDTRPGISSDQAVKVAPPFSLCDLVIGELWLDDIAGSSGLLA